MRVKIDYRTLPDFDSRLHIVCFGVSSEFDIHTIDYHYHLEKDDCLLKQIIFLEKDVFRLVTSVGQTKNSESAGIKPQTFGFRAPMLYH